MVATLPSTLVAGKVDPFEYANVGSYDGLSRIWEENHTVAPGFVDINVTPTSEWTQQPSGPR